MTTHDRYDAVSHPRSGVQRGRTIIVFAADKRPLGIRLLAFVGRAYYGFAAIFLSGLGVWVIAESAKALARNLDLGQVLIDLAIAAPLIVIFAALGRLIFGQKIRFPRKRW